MAQERRRSRAEHAVRHDAFQAIYNTAPPEQRALLDRLIDEVQEKAYRKGQGSRSRLGRRSAIDLVMAYAIELRREITLDSHAVSSPE